MLHVVIPGETEDGEAEMYRTHTADGDPVWVCELWDRVPFEGLILDR